MVRLHSKKHGKSSRKRPKAKISPKWVEYSENEIKKLIISLSKEGTSPTMIGLILRDQYGVPAVKPILKKTLTQFLKQEKLLQPYPNDLLNLIKKATKMREHLKNNKKDVHNNVKLLHTESKIYRLVKYYNRTKKLPLNWKYDAKSAALLVK